MNIIKRVVAWVFFIPSFLICGIPFFMIHAFGPILKTNAEQKSYLWGKWYIRPALWCHLWTMCGGDLSKQRY